MNLTCLSDEELLRHLANTEDRLTSTDAELELRRRFAALLDERAPLLAVLDAQDYEVTPEQLKDALAVITGWPDARALLEACSSRDIYTDAELTAQIELGDKFTALANDAGDIFERLASLSSTTTV